MGVRTVEELNLAWARTTGLNLVQSDAGDVLTNRTSARDTQISMVRASIYSSRQLV